MTNKKKRQVITQKALQRYVELKQADEERQELRLQLLQLINEDADIEPGPLTASRITRTQRRFTIASLTTLLGRNQVMKLRSELPLAEYVHLIVQMEE